MEEPRDMKIPEKYEPKFKSPAVRITFFIPAKLKQELVARAYRLSTEEELVSMGEAARDLLMGAIYQEESHEHEQ